MDGSNFWIGLTLRLESDSFNNRVLKKSPFNNRAKKFRLKYAIWAGWAYWAGRVARPMYRSTSINMALVGTKPTLATTSTDAFNRGNIHYNSFNVHPSNTISLPPKPLLIVTPTVEGIYESNLNSNIFMP